MNALKKWWGANWKNAVAVIITEIVTGFFLSFLINANFGTDPCTFMNLALAEKTGITFGTWQVLLNVILFVPMLIFSRPKDLGVGTIANMTLIGYASDFSRFVMSKIFQADFFTHLNVRIIFLIVGLIGFVICCAIYMNLDAGLVPYDSIPKMVYDHMQIKSFTPVRMCWDFLSIAIGMLIGHHLPNIGNILMALLLGPTISFVGNHFFKKLETDA